MCKIVGSQFSIKTVKNSPKLEPSLRCGHFACCLATVWCNTLKRSSWNDGTASVVNSLSSAEPSSFVTDVDVEVHGSIIQALILNRVSGSLVFAHAAFFLLATPEMSGLYHLASGQQWTLIHCFQSSYHAFEPFSKVSLSAWTIYQICLSSWYSFAKLMGLLALDKDGILNLKGFLGLRSSFTSW